MAAFVVLVCSVRFLFDGVHIGNFSFGHVDAIAYGSILTPVLAAHGFTYFKDSNYKQKVDDPDATD